MCSWGFNGLEFNVWRIPKVQVSFGVTFHVSCAYKSKLRKLKGSLAERGKVFVAVVATP